MRSIKELLQVMLDNKHLFSAGLCQWVVSCNLDDHITHEEYITLDQFIQNNKPKGIFKRYLIKWRGGFYWKPYKIKPRIKWIKYHISKN